MGILRIDEEDSYFPQGGIMALPPELEGIELALVWLKVHDANAVKDLWTPETGLIPVEVVVDHGWELMVRYQVRSTIGSFSVFATGVAFGSTYDSRYGTGKRHATGPSSWDVNDLPDLQFDPFPNEDVTLRLHWGASNAYTDSPPPDSGETAW